MNGRDSRSWRALLILGLWFASGVVRAEPWVNYLGSHYRPQPWANSVRDPQGAGFFAAEYGPQQLALLQSLGSDKHLLYNVGGLGSGRSDVAVDHFLTHMLLTLGQDWQQLLRTNAGRVPASAAPVYWQFGNEINSRRFSETLSTWEGQARKPRAHDLASIPYYVEYFLAPGVAALAEHGQRQRIKVVLGSIAVAANPRAQGFLEALLNYRVQGLMAPGLRGTPVYALVDVVSLHYIAGANSADWRAGLDQLHQRWLATGRLEALWSTEEVGLRRAKRNEGGAAGLIVLARYMDWWQSHGLTARQGRAFFWGADRGRRGTTTDETMNALLQQIGAQAEWQRLTGKPVFAGRNVESYGFQLSPGNRRLWLVFPGDQHQSAQVAVAASPGQARARLIGPAGIRETALAAEMVVPAGSVLLVIAEGK